MEPSLQVKKKKGNVETERIFTKGFTLIVLSNFFTFLGFQMTLPTLPLYVEHLGGNDQLIGLIVGIFTFAALIIRPFAGKAVDTKGRGLIYLVGLGIFIVSVGTYGLLYSMIFLFLLRIFQGIGWGLSTTASGTIATDFIPPKRRGEGMGYFGLSGNIAIAFGPSLGLTLVGVITFSQLFIICALLGVISFILGIFIPYKKDLEKEENTTVQKKKWDIYERTALPPSILLFFITFTFGGIASFLPIYANEKNIDGIHLYFLFYAASVLISRTFSGRIYDKKGHKAVFLPGTILILTTMLLLFWLPNKWILFLAAILYGFGFGMVQPALQAWSVKEATIDRRGMANATFFSFFDLGIGIGAIVFGQFSHLFGYSKSYLVSALSVLISITLYFVIARKEVKKQS